MRPIETLPECLKRTANWRSADKRALAILACAWIQIQNNIALYGLTAEKNAARTIEHAQDYVEMSVLERQPKRFSN